MQARFKVTIRKLKNKLKAGGRERRRLRAVIYRRDRQIARLIQERDALQKRLTPTPVPHHHYPAQLIALAVFIVVQAKGSLRCAAKTAGFYARLMGWDFRAPSHAMVDNWVRRLGLYAMEHRAGKTGAYLAILDESIQIGREKLLLLLGVKLEPDCSHWAPLRMSDVEVLGCEVQPSWTAEQVADFVQRRQQHHDDMELRYVVSDEGPNLVKAYAHLGLPAVADCSHRLMNALKKLLAEDGILRQLTAFMGQYRRQHLLSERSYLCPPTLRDKDRFLRLFVILDWMDRLDKFWPGLPQAHRQSLALLHTPAIRQLIGQLRQLRRVISMATKILKTSGLNAAGRRAWQAALADYRRQVQLGPWAEHLIQTVQQYYEDHAALIARHGRLICCSDIIESTFGHYKNKGGMKVISSDVLALPLLAGELNIDFVRQGLQTVSQKQLDRWCRQYICDNRYSTFQRMRKQAKSSTAAA